METKGIVLLALGHPFYGQMAYNLALSIKATDANVKISLLWKDKGKSFLTDFSKFDQIIEVPNEMVTKNGIESFIKAKTFLCDLSPYDSTIFIDADVILFPYKPITHLFNEFKDIDFTIGCRSEDALETNPRLIWSNPKEMKEIHNIDNVYNLSSEFIYFKKTDKVKEFFDLAKKYFDNPGITYTRFSGGVPDELAFQIAMSKCDIRPHKIGWLPFYWESYEKKSKMLHDLYKENWYGISAGGSALPKQTKDNYNQLSKVYSQKFHTSLFLITNKRDWLKNRQHI